MIEELKINSELMTQEYRTRVIKVNNTFYILNKTYVLFYIM